MDNFAEGLSIYSYVVGSVLIVIAVFFVRAIFMGGNDQPSDKPKNKDD